MVVGLLTLKIYLPGCASLKEKRSRLKPLLEKMRRDFNLSVAEADFQDVWQSSLIACAAVGNDPSEVRRLLQATARWVDEHGRDILLEEEQIEFR